MEEMQIKIVINAVSALTAAEVFVALRMLGKSGERRKKLLKAYYEISGLLREKGRSGSLYQKGMSWLLKNGAPCHYGRWVEPVRFLACCVVLGLAGVLACAPLGAGYGAAAFFLLGFLPVWLLQYLNKKDNEKLLPELKLVYHALEIQIRAGVYVTDAMAECYGNVQEKRLRQALLELAGDIVMKADVHDSLERFQGKFSNAHIDSLCIIILQALESGQAVELLQDIGEQVKDMEAAVLERKKAALDRKLTFCQLGVLTVVLGIALYLCVSYMFGAASLF
ncbi:MAG: type II secretion system F family protein [Butyrivibrio sp.]|nr:type II secretion system F family protein [Acetatifactor muris]MCM1559729.1 type II secretion system F family protein [Butyrivibrio sp.]